MIENTETSEVLEIKGENEIVTTNDLVFLVVDGFFTMRRIIKRQLHDIGYNNVVEASDCQQAHSVLKDITIDLVITDWDLTDMVGGRLAQSIRNDVPIGAMPIIVTLSGEMTLTEAEMTNIDDYLNSTHSADDLKEKINKALKKRI